MIETIKNETLLTKATLRSKEETRKGLKKKHKSNQQRTKNPDYVERERKPSGLDLNLEEGGGPELEGDSENPRFITNKM